MPQSNSLYKSTGGPTQTTQANTTNGAKLGASTQTGSSFDGCINQSQSCTTAVIANNQ